jgi:hypothetical protein
MPLGTAQMMVLGRSSRQRVSRIGGANPLAQAAAAGHLLPGRPYIRWPGIWNYINMFGVRAVANACRQFRWQNVVSQKRERLDRIDEAFLHERSIDRQTYERQRDQLREQLALAEIELNDAVLDQLDIDGVLAFAEHVVTNAARLWMELDLVQKQRLQQVLFPEGLRFDGERFGTAATCLAFKKLDGNSGPEFGMASPPPFAGLVETREAGTIQHVASPIRTARVVTVMLRRAA